VRRMLLIAAAAALVWGIAGAAGAALVDPYDIYERHMESVGGIEAVRAETTLYFEAEIDVSGTKGSIKHWAAPGGRNRVEVDLGIFQQVQGSDGEVLWSVDPNGKLQFARDDASLTRAELERRMQRLEHLDRDSEVFTLELDGLAPVGDRKAYVVRIINGLNDDVTMDYFDTKTFEHLKRVASVGQTEEIVLLSDFREAGGLVRAHRHDVTIAPIGQKHTVTMKLFRSNEAIDPSLFDPPEDDARDFAFVEGESAEGIPMRFIEGHVYLEVAIGGEPRLWVLDTGASMSVVDTGFAEELGLEPEGDMKGAGAGNAVDVSFAALPPFEVPGIRFESQMVAVIDVSELFRRTTDIDVVGILGYDFLSRFVTRIDYANETLSFYLPDVFAYEGDGVSLDAPLRHHIFTVPASVDGEHSGMWVLDVGASGISFHYPYAKEHGIVDLDGVEHVGFGAGGRLEGKGAEFETIEVGGYVVPDPVIGFPMAPVAGAFGATDELGNLGSTLFRHFVLYLDYDEQRVIFEEGDDFGTVFPRDGGGVQFWRPEEEIEVLFVSPGTPAESAGFREGDVLRTVNGVDVGEFGNLRDLREILRDPPGTTHTFGVERDGSAETIALTLAELF